MKKAISIFILILFIQSLQGQQFKKKYSTNTLTYNGYYFKGKLLSIPTSDDGIIYTGHDNLNNINVTKLNNTGCIQWSYSYEFGSFSKGTMIKQLADGGYLVGGNLNQNTLNDSGLLMKINASGNVVWSKLLNISEFITDCAQIGNTVIVTTGQTGGSSESSVIEVDQAQGNINSIKKFTRTPVDENDVHINCHFNRVLPVSFGGYYLVGDVESISQIRKPLLVYVDPTMPAPIFRVFSHGSSIDEVIEQPSNTFIFAIENFDYSYISTYPNSFSRMTLIKMSSFGSFYWQKFYVPQSTSSGVAQHYPNSITQTSNGDLLICGSLDQMGTNLNYLLKINSSGNIIGNMHKMGTTNSGITSLHKTVSDDFTAAFNGNGIIRFPQSLTNLCDDTEVAFVANDDTITQIDWENGTVNSITNPSIDVNVSKYSAVNNVTTTCGYECPSLKCYENVNNNSNLAVGLLAYYPFGSGSIKDYSGNGNHLINTTGAHSAPDRNGNADCAFEFDNIPDSNNQFISTAATGFLDGLSEYSISLWYQALDSSREATAYETLVGRDYTSIHCPDRTGQWTLGLYDLRRATFGRQNSVWQNNLDNPTGSWHHLTATYNQVGETIKLYRDGILQETKSGLADCGFGGNSFQDIGDLFIGKNFTGVLDDIFIHNRELSQAEINQIISLGSSCCSDNILAVSDISSQELPKAKVFPNPSSNLVYIETEGKIQSVELYDIEGRAITVQTISDNIIDVTKLNSGTYVVRVATNLATDTIKIIKK